MSSVPSRQSITASYPQTTSTNFSRSSFSVLRRYSDFLWLYETLSLNNPGVVVPPTPEKNPSPFGRFDTNFVEQRRLALEKCVNKIANHPVLQKDGDLKIFLESDSFALDVSNFVRIPLYCCTLRGMSPLTDFPYSVDQAQKGRSCT